MKKFLPLIVVVLLAFIVVNTCGAQTIVIPNPLADVDEVGDLLIKILDWLKTIIVAISLIFIVIGALLYITSAGNDKRMETAKSAITASLTGLAIGLAAPTFLKEITTILGYGVAEEEVAAAKSFAEIALETLEFLLSIVGVLGIIMLVAGGIMYLTSAGDEDRIKKAKGIITYSILGIVVALGALVIVTQLAKLIAP